MSYYNHIIKSVFRFPLWLVVWTALAESTTFRSANYNVLPRKLGYVIFFLFLEQTIMCFFREVGDLTNNCGAQLCSYCVESDFCPSLIHAPVIEYTLLLRCMLEHVVSYGELSCLIHIYKKGIITFGNNTIPNDFFVFFIWMSLLEVFTFWSIVSFNFSCPSCYDCGDWSTERYITNHILDSILQFLVWCLCIFLVPNVGDVCGLFISLFIFSLQRPSFL
jgi:hypothetical protein